MSQSLKIFLIALLGGMPLFAQYSFDFTCLDDTTKYITDTTTLVQFYFRLENTGTLPDSYAFDCRVIDSVPGWDELYCAGGSCALPGIILYDYLNPGEVDTNIYIAVYPDSHYGTEFLRLHVSSVKSPNLQQSINVYVIKEMGITEDKEGLSINTADFQSYPNPFRNKINIKYSIGHSAESIELKIYDATGRLIKQFNHLTIQPFNQIVWDGTDDRGLAVPAGIYFIKLEQNGFKKPAKMIIRLK